jgi:hypothetical protein
MMNDSRASGQALDPPPPGLCGRCLHARTVTTARGSHFLRCALAAVDDRFAKYPRLPVLACDGYRPAPAEP